MSFWKWWLIFQAAILGAYLLLWPAGALPGFTLRDLGLMTLLFEVFICLPLAWAAADTDKHSKEIRRKIDEDPEGYEEYLRLRGKFR